MSRNDINNDEKKIKKDSNNDSKRDGKTGTRTDDRYLQTLFKLKLNKDNIVNQVAGSTESPRDPHEKEYQRQQMEKARQMIHGARYYFNKQYFGSIHGDGMHNREKNEIALQEKNQCSLFNYELYESMYFSHLPHHQSFFLIKNVFIFFIYHFFIDILSYRTIHQRLLL